MDIKLIRKDKKVFLYGNKEYSYLVRWRGNPSAGNQFTIRLHNGDFFCLLHLNEEGNIELAPDDSTIFPYNENETTPVKIYNAFQPINYVTLDVPIHNGFNKRSSFFQNNKIEMSQYGYYLSTKQELFL